MPARLHLCSGRNRGHNDQRKESRKTVRFKFGETQICCRPGVGPLLSGEITDATIDAQTREQPCALSLARLNNIVVPAEVGIAFSPDSSAPGWLSVGLMRCGCYRSPSFA